MTLGSDGDATSSDLGTVEPARKGSKSKSPPLSNAAPVAPQAVTFFGAVDVKPATAKMRLVQIAEEIIAQLISDPQANVTVTLEIKGEFSHGVSDQIKRAVSENATNLAFKNKSWE